MHMADDKNIHSFTKRSALSRCCVVPWFTFTLLLVESPKLSYSSMHTHPFSRETTALGQFLCALTMSQSSSVIVPSATLLGAWIGSFVIPLDWNQPWQIFPYPCVIGASLCHVFTTMLESAALFRILTNEKRNK